MCKNLNIQWVLELRRRIALVLLSMRSGFRQRKSFARLCVLTKGRESRHPNDSYPWPSSLHYILGLQFPRIDLTSPAPESDTCVQMHRGGV